MKIRALAAVAILTLLAGSLLTGCVDLNKGGVVGNSDTIQLGHNDINPEPLDKIRDGGNLRLPILALPSNWNPISNDGNDVETAEMMWPMMPRAFSTDASGRLSVNHDFFTNVEMVKTNPQTVVYTINPKAVWSDGSPITWADIAAQAHALSLQDTGFLIAMANGFDRVGSVTRGVDDRQAVITFNKPYADWRGQFSGNSMLMPKSVTATPDAFNNSLVNSPTLTAGPFTLQSIDRTQGRVVLKRNPLWWGAKPKLDTMTFTSLDSSATVSALQNNELDATGLGSIDDVQNARNTPDVVIRHTPSTGWDWIIFNGAPGSTLADPKVRVAIAKAIDRQSIANTLQFGLVEHPHPLNNHVYLEGQQGYQDNSAPVGYSPEEAATELDALGWTLHHGIREKNGKQLVIRDVYYQDDTWQELAQILQQQLGAIGVKLTVDPRPGQDYFTKVMIPGDFDIAQFSEFGDTFALNSLPQEFAYNPGDEESNFGRIGTPELNALIDHTVGELDPDRAIALANKVDLQLFQEGHSLPLFQSPGDIAVRDNVANYGAPGFASYDYTKIGFLK